jgi:hypothetical protein
MTPLVRELFSAVPVVDGIWFDVGKLPDKLEIKIPVLRGNPLPFEHCLIVGRDAVGNKFLVVASQVLDADPYSHAPQDPAILLIGYTLFSDSWQRTPLFAAVIEQEGWRIGDLKDEEKVDQKMAYQVVAITSHFLDRLNEQVLGYHPTLKQNSLTNRRLLHKGKPPSVFTWTTVIVEPCQALKQPAKGGTHASPREHDRRGHWRTLPDRRQVWVRPCKVGDPELGRSDHDYRFT